MGGEGGWLLMDVKRLPRKQQANSHLEETVNKEKHFIYLFLQVGKTSEKLQNRLQHTVKHTASFRSAADTLRTAPPSPLFHYRDK